MKRRREKNPPSTVSLIWGFGLFGFVVLFALGMRIFAYVESRNAEPFQEIPAVPYESFLREDLREE